MPNLAAVTTLIALLFGGGQNECLPRTAALCAAICLALAACAQPAPAPHPTPPTPLPATPAPFLATPSPAPLPSPPPESTPTQPARPPAAPPPPSPAVPPIAAQPPPSPAPTHPSVAIPTPAIHPTTSPTAPARQPLAPAATPVAQIDLPKYAEDVAFTQITVGATHACGLRENAAAICWGEDPNDHGILDVPAQTAFRQISAGVNFTCGLRQDQTIACWGNNSAGQATPPQGSFTEITAGPGYACAIPLPQGSPPALLCWGAPFPNGAEPLLAQLSLSDIQAGNRFACGLTPKADMACLSIERRLPEITPGPFASLGVGLNHVCALREHGSAYCHRRNNLFQARPPPTKFAQIAAGRFHSCGITRASRIECWGSGRPASPGERLTAPAGEFIAIAIGWQNSCALRPNGRAVCWHTPEFLPVANLAAGVSLAFGGAKFSAPVELFPWPSGGLAVVEREGIIAIHHDQPDAPSPQTILDISHAVACCGGEGGMLSAAIDPQFQDFPFLYVWYTPVADSTLAGAAPGIVGRLARFRVDRDVALQSSELTILEVPLPGNMHLGGAIRFGADGMLYLGIGDGGTPDDAQALDRLPGKIIRIDARGANTHQPYRILPDNPFVDNPDARPEIWAYGLRNPWRMAFNPKNPGSLFIADVGSKTWEEISIATAGANLGWPLCEGYLCQESLAAAAAANLAPPAVAYAYRTDRGCAVIGGHFVPWLDDRYLFGDLCSRRVYLLERDSPPDAAQAVHQDIPQAWRMREIADLSPLTRGILAFGAGENGSVYVLSHNGPILRLHPELFK